MRDTDKVTLSVRQIKELVKEAKQKRSVKESKTKVPGFIYDEADLARALMKYLDHAAIQMIANSIQAEHLDFELSDPKSYAIFADRLTEEVIGYLRHFNN